MVSSVGIHPLEITLAEYLASRQSEPVRVIDVREQDEWDAGHMAEATLLPLGELEERHHELDRESPLVIVCRSGRRSLVAADYLHRLGFSEARSLAGGMITWAATGRPVER